MHVMYKQIHHVKYYTLEEFRYMPDLTYSWFIKVMDQVAKWLQLAEGHLHQ